MSYAAFQPRLRLVGSDRSAEPPAASTANAPPPALANAEREIVKENRLAAHAGSIDVQQIDPRDPRWILAMQTQARLQGSTLTPEHRDELLASGKNLGLRAFESNLVIAVVQDHARRQQPLRLTMSAVPGIIGIHASPEPRTMKPARTWRWWIAAIATASMMATFIIRWLTEMP